MVEIDDLVRIEKIGLNEDYLKKIRFKVIDKRNSMCYLVRMKTDGSKYEEIFKLTRHQSDLHIMKKNAKSRRRKRTKEKIGNLEL